MGLDMYLRASISLPTTEFTGERDNKNRAITYTPALTQGIASLCGVSSDKLPEFNRVTVTIPVGYWRKANWIHAWFIKDQPEDDCDPIEVSLEQLNELDAICKQVLANKSDPEKCAELLPTRGGFFFGPTDLMDSETFEWYIDDVKHTRKIIANCRQLAESMERATKDSPCFEYQASW